MNIHNFVESDDQDANKQEKVVKQNLKTEPTKEKSIQRRTRAQYLKSQEEVKVDGLGIQLQKN